MTLEPTSFCWSCGKGAEKGACFCSVECKRRYERQHRTKIGKWSGHSKLRDEQGQFQGLIGK